MRILKSFVLPLLIIIVVGVLVLPTPSGTPTSQTAQVADSGQELKQNTTTPPVVTLPPINITRTSATLRGDARWFIVNPGTEKLHSQFNFFYPNNEMKEVGYGYYTREYSFTVTGLTCGTTYSYQASTLKVGNGAMVTFSTLPCATDTDIRVSVSATPNPVTRGGTSQVTLSTQDVTRCSSSDLGLRELGTSGVFPVENITNSRTITVSCQNDQGVSRVASVTINVITQTVQPRIISFSVNPQSVRAGERATLTWTSEGATGCVIDGLLAKPVRPTSGSVTTDPVNSHTTYTLTCSNDSGAEARATAVVRLQADPIVTPTVAILQFQASPATVFSGGQVTLSWGTSNASSCRLNGEMVNVNDSRVVTLFNSQQYTLVCTGVDGQTVGQSRFITVDTTNTGGGGSTQNPIIGGFSSNPLSVPQGEFVTLFWNSDAEYCVAQGGWSGQKPASGSERVGPVQANQTYTLVCYKNGRTTTQTITVFVQNNQNAVVSQNSAAFTTVPTRARATSVDLNGTALIGNNTLTQGWFEWGTSRDLGRVTEIRSIGTSRTVDFSETLSGLSPNTTYFYRAVIQNNTGVYRGDIVPFTTTRIVTNVQTSFSPQPVRTTRVVNTQSVAITPNPGQSLQAQTYGRPVFIELSLSQRAPSVVQGSVVEYDIRYRNITNTLLTNTFIKVVLPEDFAFISSNRGIYSPESRVLTLYLGEVQPREDGSFSIAVSVSPQAEIGKTVVITGYANYTIPATSQFREYQDEVIAYALSRIDQNNGSGTGQVAAIGQIGFWQSDFGRAVLWLILILILLLIIYLTRKVYMSFKGSK